MDDKKFEAIMVFLVPQIVKHIMENYPMSEVEASKAFYESGIYAILEQEETKLWHLSPLALFDMFDEERKTGRFEIPEEV